MLGKDETVSPPRRQLDIDFAQLSPLDLHIYI